MAKKRETKKTKTAKAPTRTKKKTMRGRPIVDDDWDDIEFEGGSPVHVVVPEYWTPKVKANKKYELVLTIKNDFKKIGHTSLIDTSGVKKTLLFPRRNFEAKMTTYTKWDVKVSVKERKATYTFEDKKAEWVFNETWWQGKDADDVNIKHIRIGGKDYPGYNLVKYHQKN